MKTTTKQPTFKKLILDELKAKGLTDLAKKVKSARYESYSGGDSLRVVTLDPTAAEREIMKAIVDQYQYGDFDGMTDSYNYRDNAAARSVKYAFAEFEYSDAAKAQVKQILADKFGVTDDATAREKMFIWFDQAVHRELVKVEKWGAA